MWMFYTLMGLLLREVALALPVTVEVEAVVGRQGPEVAA